MSFPCLCVCPVSCAVPMFDQLSELSKVKGPDANPRSISTYDRKLISVGSQPMIALYNVSKVRAAVHDYVCKARPHARMNPITN